MGCKKEITEYFLRVFCFAVVVKCAFDIVCIIGIIVFLPFSVLVLKVFDLLFIIFDKCGYYFLVESFEYSYDVYIFSFFGLYFLSKILGIFKKINKLNFFLSLFIICLISYMLVLFGRINFLVDKNTYELGLRYFYTMYLLIPCYLLYKVFNFLSSKFIIFEKIGYYTSIEFYKNLYKKISNHGKHDNK